MRIANPFRIDNPKPIFLVFPYRFPKSSCPMKILGTLTLLLAFAAFRLQSAPATLTVEVDQPGIKVSPMLYGIFFEDINCSADGGIYAELIRNRNFEEPASGPPPHWSILSNNRASVEATVAPANPAGTYILNALKVAVSGEAQSRCGVANNGFWGIALQKGAKY